MGLGGYIPVPFFIYITMSKIDTIQISGSSYDIQDSAATTALGGLKLVKLTQQEYDALAPNYDSNTLYVING